jgi:hypothetical protein
MKALIIFILWSISIASFGQNSLYITGGIGQSRHFHYNSRILRDGIGTTLNPVFSANIGSIIIKEMQGSIKPYTGISILILGSLNKKEMHSSVNPGMSFLFRHVYLALPVGLNIPVYEKVGIDLALINGWHLNDRSSKIIGTPRIWDIAIQPGAYYSLKQWRMGISYYYGIRDVFGLGKVDRYNDLRFFNHAIHFNVAYKLRSFDKN